MNEDIGYLLTYLVLFGSIFRPSSARFSYEKFSNGGETKKYVMGHVHCIFEAISCEFYTL